MRFNGNSKNMEVVNRISWIFPEKTGTKIENFNNRVDDKKTVLLTLGILYVSIKRIFVQF